MVARLPDRCMLHTTLTAPFYDRSPIVHERLAEEVDASSCGEVSTRQRLADSLIAGKNLLHAG